MQTESEKKKIMVVDDERYMLDLLELILKQDYEVFPFINSENALYEVEKIMPDLIISDIRMPLMDGYELCRKIKSHEKVKHIPLVLLSSYGNSAMALEAGADDYLVKPFRNAELKEYIAEIFDTGSSEMRMQLDPMGLNLILADSEKLTVEIKEPDPVTGLPSLYARVDEVKKVLKAEREIGVVFVEISPVVEEDEIYNLKAFDQILKTLGTDIASDINGLLSEGDIVTMNRPMSNSFILFLHNQGSTGWTPKELNARITSFQEKAIEKLSHDFSSEILSQFNLVTGFSIMDYSSKINILRLIYRKIKDAEMMAQSEILVKNQSLKTEFKKIIRNNSLQVVFHPIIRVSSNGHKPEIAGHEALIRGPVDSNLRNPEMLFLTADRIGEKDALDFLCIQNALGEFNRASYSQLRFINIEPASVLKPTLKKYIIENKDSMSFDNVVLEITERETIDDLNGFNRHLDFFRNHGIRIALDDAGSGFSSLNHVLKIKPDFIKLASILTTSIHEDKMKFTMVKAFTDFSRSNGIQVIAEGVELLEEYHSLLEAGVDFVQGFFFGRPASPPPAIDPRAQESLR